MKIGKTLLTCSVVLASFLMCAQATIIDDFSDYDAAGAGPYDMGIGWSITGPAAGITIAETGLTGTLGGNRTTTYTSAGTYGTSLVLYPGIITAINNAPTYATAVYSYSGFSIDLTTGTKLVLDFDPDHLTYIKNAVISMSISDGTVTNTVTKNSWGSLPYDPDRFDLEFLVADYTGVDKTAITSISLSLETDDAGDYALYGISTDAIPEPAALGLLGICTGGIWFVRRRFLPVV